MSSMYSIETGRSGHREGEGEFCPGHLGAMKVQQERWKVGEGHSCGPRRLRRELELFLLPWEP